MASRIEVAIKDGQRDVVGEQLKKKIENELKISVNCRFVEVYNIEESFDEETLKKLGEEAFADRIIQTAHWNGPSNTNQWRLEVGFLPGVTDNVGNSARQAVYDALGKETPVYYSRMYCLEGNVDELGCERIAKLLHNPLVERYRVHAPSKSPDPYLAKVEIHEKIKVAKITLDPKKKSTHRLVEQRLLALNMKEVEAIVNHLKSKRVLKERKKLGLDERATDVELEAIAQTWSEHCKHKIFNAKIDYDEEGQMHTINGLFSVFIKGATEAVRKPYVVSVFEDNGGIIKFDTEHDIAAKVETHNAPSALDPYGGSLTGVLGVQRDVLGTGLGATPIANLDVLCFGMLDGSHPQGTLSPRRIFEGVTKGIEHAGNKTGIPTVNGSIIFEKEFAARPLVYCGTIGVMPSEIKGRKSREKIIKPGYLALMVGGRIGKDGIHGATFSSQQIDENVPQSVVQIGDPITQKKMIDFVLEARDNQLYEAVTDNGAGGLSSSVGELARLSGGCEVYLYNCPLKYPGLQPWEILLSESQERMTLAVKQENMEELEQLAKKHEVEITIVGKFTDSGYFHCLYHAKTVAYLDMKFLHEGLPQLNLKANWQRKLFNEPEIEETDLGEVLKKLLRQPNISSKECVVRQYDHEVRGGTVVKPTGGVNDAAVVQPILKSKEGIVIAHGICPKIIHDSYAMATLAFDEAVRNALAVGGKFGYLAALDNFSWPDPITSEKNPDGEYKLAQLIRACSGVYDVATAYGIPLISGKDSMKNDYYVGNQKYSILPTLLMTVVGKIEDVHKAITAEFKEPGDHIYVIGTTKEELGGSEYYKLFGAAGMHEPKINIKENVAVYKALSDATSKGLVASMHDISDGGLAVTLAESSMFSSGGVDINLRSMVRKTERDDVLLFSENPGRYVVSVKESNVTAFEKTMQDLPYAQIGRVRGDKRFIIRGINNEILINEETRNLRQEWEKGVC